MKNNTMTPQEIVNELNRYIVGQSDAKKNVAIAIRNRWRRKQLDQSYQAEIMPRNILMIGTTGVGKTEIARRISKLINAPFIKVEATKFTEVGYVGRDVDSIIRDLVTIAIGIKNKEHYERCDEAAMKKAIDKVAKKVANQLGLDNTNSSIIEDVIKKIKNGDYDGLMIRINVEKKPSNLMNDMMDSKDIQMNIVNITEMINNSFPGMKNIQENIKKVSVIDAINIIKEEEVFKMTDQDQIAKEAIESVEQDGIVFIDEIDKIIANREARGGDISREGVQRDLLPLIEGTTVQTKYGHVKTDHILFIASGAFHIARPSDMLPELQGRLPVRVKLNSLTVDDLEKILIDPEYNIILQSKILLETEGLKVSFRRDSIRRIAELAAEMNSKIDDIGARRLHAILEKSLEDISFNATEISKDKKDIEITPEDIERSIEGIYRPDDNNKYII